MEKTYYNETMNIFFTGGALVVPSRMVAEPSDKDFGLCGFVKEGGTWMKDGVAWDGSALTVPSYQVFNPSEQELFMAGYTEYVAPAPPEPTEEELLQQAKDMKIAEIEEYDSSDAVNSFTIGGQQMWLDFEERSRLLTSVQAYEAMGASTMTKWFGGTSFTFPLELWKQMLVALEVYAGDALNVTEAHKAAVTAMESVAEIEAFDHTEGYPEKLEF